MLSAAQGKRHVMNAPKPLVLPSDVTGFARAAEMLRAGQLVAFPTETVYGLGADATNGPAVAKIFAAKGRPSFNPLIVHVSDIEHAQRLVKLSGKAIELAEHFWPGPLTFVAPLRCKEISALVTTGLKTLAVRVPAHPSAQAILADCPNGIAAPSANPSGRISPTTAAHVVSGLGAQIDAVLDGGSCSVGLESTILSVEEDEITLLRAGGLSAERITEVAGSALRPAPLGHVTAPGMLASHYAPNARLRLNAKSPMPEERWLGFGPDHFGGVTLSAQGDLTEAAANLFAVLHRLDAEGDTPIAVAPVPKTGLGLAINDRLTRAAARR